jgi:hypothetical protein
LMHSLKTRTRWSIPSVTEGSVRLAELTLCLSGRRMKVKGILYWPMSCNCVFTFGLPLQLVVIFLFLTRHSHMDIELIFKIFGGIGVVSTLFLTWRTNAERATFDMIDRSYSLCLALEEHLLREWRLSHRRGAFPIRRIPLQAGNHASSEAQREAEAPTRNRPCVSALR